MVRTVRPYRQLERLINREALEPDVSWGIRMAIAAMAPLLWGIYTNNIEQAGWIALIAECICWVELKGDFQHRLKLLAGSSALALISALLGSVTGFSILLSVVLMGIVAFFSSVLKNIGSRGGGMSICVYAIFIFCNAYPTESIPELQERSALILIGILWNGVAAVAASLFIPAQRPYKRFVATIWKSIAELTEAISKGWDGVGVRSNEHDIYLKEKGIRTAIDDSLEFFDKLSDEASEQDGDEYVLAHVRKAAALVGVQVTMIAEELEAIERNNIDQDIRIKVFTLLRALEQTMERLAVYTIAAEKGEELVVRSRINRLFKLSALLKEQLENETVTEKESFLRLVHIAERTTRIIESSYENLKKIAGERSMVRSYPLMKTIFILHPKYWVKYIRLLFDFSTFTARYGLRSAIAAGLAMFIYRFWDIDHGYWIPFTLIIVMQTYFGATLTKARDRILGTLAGGIVGGLFLKLPTGLYLQEAMLFMTFIPMIIYIRTRYSVAAFFITLNLVLLFNINREMSDTLIITRALSTVAGAGLAVAAGFLVMPMWDKKWLPVHLANAVYTNYEYFLSVFYKREDNLNWTRCKRKAESGNSNVYDSFNRYMNEPKVRRRPFAIFYYIITHNIRITRELNNICLELEHDEGGTAVPDAEHTALVEECGKWLNKNIELLPLLSKEGSYNIVSSEDIASRAVVLNKQQVVFLEKMLVELKGMHSDMKILSEKMPRMMQL